LCRFCRESFQHLKSQNQGFSTSLNILYVVFGKIYFCFIDILLPDFNDSLTDDFNKKSEVAALNCSVKRPRLFFFIFSYFFTLKLYPDIPCSKWLNKVNKKSGKNAKEHKRNHRACHYSHSQLFIFHNYLTIYFLLPS